MTPHSGRRENAQVNRRSVYESTELPLNFPENGLGVYEPPYLAWDAAQYSADAGTQGRLSLPSQMVRRRWPVDYSWWEGRAGRRIVKLTWSLAVCGHERCWPDATVFS